MKFIFCNKKPEDFKVFEVTFIKFDNCFLWEKRRALVIAQIPSRAITAVVNKFKGATQCRCLEVIDGFYRIKCFLGEKRRLKEDLISCFGKKEKVIALAQFGTIWDEDIWGNDTIWDEVI